MYTICVLERPEMSPYIIMTSGNKMCENTLYIQNQDIIKDMCVYLQVRDEYRTEYDSGRGGYGKFVSNKMSQELGGL